ncbi:classical arabinogalactan protein 26-like [Senna tora]|uniref:Classical arabinogalactan protein 26-like n=1 Tax=Senna tora TaxID=362788 RepID=A0A834WDZ1_9FABA|nr:classical arabinogalactan protein 26-like [Senna tora]
MPSFESYIAQICPTAKQSSFLSLSKSLNSASGQTRISGSGCSVALEAESGVQYSLTSAIIFDPPNAFPRSSLFSTFLFITPSLSEIISLSESVLLKESELSLISTTCFLCLFPSLLEEHNSSDHLLAGQKIADLNKLVEMYLAHSDQWADGPKCRAAIIETRLSWLSRLLLLRIHSLLSIPISSIPCNHRSPGNNIPLRGLLESKKSFMGISHFHMGINDGIPRHLIESAIATLADPPLSSSSSPSPFPELSPDIAPLLPSPGGVLPTPIGSDIPTIPSSPSPPNPDDDASLAHGPSSAFSPFGAIQASSNTHRTIASSSSSTMAALAGFAACCCFMMIE